MIQSLNIQKFGRFQERSFPLSKITCFVGENEAGKTTIFDAFRYLFLDIWGLTLRNTIKKSIKERYTPDTEPLLNWRMEGNLPTLQDKDAQLCLNAISFPEGEWTGLVPENNSDYKTLLKKTLFNSENDPSQAIKILQDFVNGRSSSGYKDKKKVLDKLIQDTEQDLSTKQANLQNLEGSYLESQKNAEKNKILSAEIQKLHSTKEELESQKKRLSSTLQFWSWKRQEKDLIELRESLRQKNSLSRFQKVEQEKGKELFQAAQESKAQSEMASADREKKASALSAKKTELALLQGKLLLWQNTKEKSEAYLKDLASLPRDPAYQTRKLEETIDPNSKNKALVCYLASGFFLILVMVNSFSILPGIAPEWQTLVSICFAIFVFGFAFLGVFFAKKKIQTWSIGLDEEKLSTKRLQMAIDWNEKTTELELQIPKEKKEEILQMSWNSLITESIRFQSNHQMLARAISEMETELAIATELETNKINANLSALNRYRSWMTEQDISGAEEFSQKVKERETLESQILILSNKLNISSSDCDAQILHIQSKLANYTEAVETDFHEEEFENKSKNLDRLLLETETNLNAKRKQELELVQSTAEASGALKNRTTIEKEFLNLQKTLEEKKQELALLEAKKVASSIAAGLLSEIRDDEAQQFHALLDVLRVELSQVLSNRLLEYKDLQDLSFQVQDATGDMRSLEFLSLGTKKLLLVLLKLQLALKMMGNNPIILLDDSFHSFDEPRMRSLWTYLKNLNQERNLQILFFTKPNRSLDIFKEIFGKEIQFHEL